MTAPTTSGSEHYDVVVVGAGIAGITAACYLGRSGIRTLLLEKEDKPGGLVGSFIHEGFTFDSGIRAFENSGIVYPMLRDLGIDIHACKSTVSVGIASHMVKITVQEDIGSYADMLSAVFPTERDSIAAIASDISRTMDYMDVLYGIDNPLFSDSLNDPRYLMKILLPWFIRYSRNIKKIKKMNAPVNDYLSIFTENLSLIDMITQHFFKKTPAFFALSYFGMYLDYSYPQGGTGTLIDKMIHYSMEKGVVVKTGSEVTEVYHQDKLVRLKDGNSFSYDKLIWAADNKAFYRSLHTNSLDNPETDGKIKEQIRSSQFAKGAESILSLYIGTDLSPEYFCDRCGEHAFYTPSAEGLSSIGGSPVIPDDDYVKRYLELTTYEISIPVLRDHTLAPGGCTGLIVSTLFDYDLAKAYAVCGRYTELKDLCARTVLNILEKSVFPGSTGKVRFVLTSTPLTIERITGNSSGAITGWSFDSDMIPAVSDITKIASSVKTPVADIFQAGQWAYSPAGLPTAIMTGKLAANAATGKSTYTAMGNRRKT
ncbi:NAD(P)/FAD-dependent oxidoreductase [Candidatus Nomurabacteria bacterium]|nr:NAD(P)/FAD-dependent oxidoreductase [Candidatus Nomurabacteria bacterium]